MTMTTLDYHELAMHRRQLILDLVKELDADLAMLARDEHAATGGSTAKSERASRRLMNLIALVEPDLVIPADPDS